MICTLGDVLLDVIVALDGPVEEDTDTYGETSVGTGGQAANVAAWIVALAVRRDSSRAAPQTLWGTSSRETSNVAASTCAGPSEGATGTWSRSPRRTAGAPC